MGSTQIKLKQFLKFGATAKRVYVCAFSRVSICKCVCVSQCVCEYAE